MDGTDGEQEHQGRAMDLPPVPSTSRDTRYVGDHNYQPNAHDAPSTSTSSNSGDRKRQGSVSVDDLRAALAKPCHCPFHRIVEIFPDVHASTLRQRIHHMIQYGYTNVAVVDTLVNLLMENGGDFPAAERQLDDVEIVDGIIGCRHQLFPQKHRAVQNNSNNNSATIVIDDDEDQNAGGVALDDANRGAIPNVHRVAQPILTDGDAAAAGERIIPQADLGVPFQTTGGHQQALLDENQNPIVQGRGKGKGGGKNGNRREETLLDRMGIHGGLIERFADAPSTALTHRSERLVALQQIFAGIQKASLEKCLARTRVNLTAAVVAIVQTLAALDPALAEIMLRRRIVSFSEHNPISRGPRVIQMITERFEDIKLNVMKTWRPFRRQEYRGIREEMEALDQYFEALGFVGQQPSTTPQTSPETLQSLDKADEETIPEDYECQCCFSGYAFDCLVQCFEGHLFCKHCMRQYAQSAISGESKSTLSCMAENCEESFPRGQLEAALDPKVLALLDEREQEESVRLAACETAERGETLSKCPHCPFKCYLPPGNKVIECLNPACGRATCTVCQEDWKEHFGIPCSELEKKDEAKLRKAAEEKMTAALLRRCHKCATPLIKEEGCNKLTCRCGAKMCYICRVPIKDYSHFCNHPRDPGKNCTKCKSCSLWTNPKEDDDRAIEEIRQQAEKEKQEKGYVSDRHIGVPGAVPPGAVPPK